jgi:hypothetical protein
MWESFRDGLKTESIDDLITMAGIIREELKRRGASSAWRAVE